ncbi:heat-inducible transcription repressor HrcA [Sediminihabitans luteus]|uniref:Heat-inducible transcription repressor HrcA n=1 Tax=Sediminihabitans luteus TaxID=1138585 RepID=A0A2M9CQ08_9CELL|nr:heat-inducible transcriptional repressor HrcA [Sediminihabitans luteus]PJJ73928.1 heat-inducible transcription repressor HrcA [Sediminihabitans luteus]GII98159.1 heat-inducible transcription repressor HrcA [Sediminihabitans luteus]
MSDERRLDVLRAIVEDYVTTREPVGSRMIAERHGLGVSSATIRNDMAVLEDAGYITQPHTSAGRIPTDKGYRVFVDRLSTIKSLSSPEKRAIETFLSDAVDLDDVVARAGRLLAQLTGQVAVVQYPSLRRSGLRHLELVPLAPTRLLVVIITDTGRVEQRVLELDAACDEVSLAELRVRLNVAAAGKRLSELATAFDGLAAQVRPDDQGLVRQVGALVVETLGEESEERILLSGTANLAQAGMRFEHALRPVLEALEEQVVLLNLLTEMAADGTSGVAVRIGHETQLAGLVDASVVTSGYGTGSDDDAVALVGSIGPTRMDYPATIATVRAVARYLSRILAS